MEVSTVFVLAAFNRFHKKMCFIMTMQNLSGYPMQPFGCYIRYMNMVSLVHKKIYVLHGFTHRRQSTLH